MSGFIRVPLPCGCWDHFSGCRRALAILHTTPGMQRPRIVPPWERGKDWPKPEPVQ
jgi:hypothetical protein